MIKKNITDKNISAFFKEHDLKSRQLGDGSIPMLQMVLQAFHPNNLSAVISTNLQIVESVLMNKYEFNTEIEYIRNIGLLSLGTIMANNQSVTETDFRKKYYSYCGGLKVPSDFKNSGTGHHTKTYARSIDTLFDLKNMANAISKLLGNQLLVTDILGMPRSLGVKGRQSVSVALESLGWNITDIDDNGNYDLLQGTNKITLQNEEIEAVLKRAEKIKNDMIATHFEKRLDELENDSNSFGPEMYSNIFLELGLTKGEIQELALHTDEYLRYRNEGIQQNVNSDKSGHVNFLPVAFEMIVFWYLTGINPVTNGEYVKYIFSNWKVSESLIEIGLDDADTFMEFLNLRSTFDEKIKKDVKYICNFFYQINDHWIDDIKELASNTDEASKVWKAKFSEALAHWRKMPNNQTSEPLLQDYFAGKWLDANMSYGNMPYDSFDITSFLLIEDNRSRFHRFKFNSPTYGQTLDLAVSSLEHDFSEIVGYERTPPLTSSSDHYFDIVDIYIWNAARDIFVRNKWIPKPEDGFRYFPFNRKLIFTALKLLGGEALYRWIYQKEKDAIKIVEKAYGRNNICSNIVGNQYETDGVVYGFAYIRLLKLLFFCPSKSALQKQILQLNEYKKKGSIYSNEVSDAQYYINEDDSDHVSSEEEKADLCSEFENSEYSHKLQLDNERSEHPQKIFFKSFEQLLRSASQRKENPCVKGSACGNPKFVGFRKFNIRYKEKWWRQFDSINDESVPEGLYLSGAEADEYNLKHGPKSLEASYYLEFLHKVWTNIQKYSFVNFCRICYKDDSDKDLSCQLVDSKEVKVPGYLKTFKAWGILGNADDTLRLDSVIEDYIDNHTDVESWNPQEKELDTIINQAAHFWARKGTLIVEVYIDLNSCLPNPGLLKR